MDTIVIIGIFLEESNNDIKENKAWFRDNSLDLSLRPSTNIGIENLFGLYSLTKI